MNYFLRFNQTQKKIFYFFQRKYTITHNSFLTNSKKNLQTFTGSYIHLSEVVFFVQVLDILFGFLYFTLLRNILFNNDQGRKKKRIWCNLSYNFLKNVILSLIHKRLNIQCLCYISKQSFNNIPLLRGSIQMED